MRLSVLHIMLTDKKRSDDPADPLHRTFYGWGPQDTIEENWGNNRGYWVLGARANRESYVLFSHNERHEVVMAARIGKIIDAPGKPGRKIIEGEPLPEDHAVYRAYVGRPTPDSARARNPVTYFDSTVGGWPCGCGCGEEIYAGEFVRGHRLLFRPLRAEVLRQVELGRAPVLHALVRPAVRIQFTPAGEQA